MFVCVSKYVYIYRRIICWCVNAFTYVYIYMYIHIYIYISPPPPEDPPGGLYVARSVSPSEHLAFGYNPNVCFIISHATVVLALLIATIS